jgi:hypothetical protein
VKHETPSQSNGGKTMAINGLGRIGKLTLWHHVARKYFGDIVVDIGSETGAALVNITHSLESDSIYGSLQGILNCLATTDLSHLLQSIKGVSWQAILIILLFVFCKSVRATIIRPDRVEAAFKQWAAFLGLSEKWRVWFIALYVITGIVDYIGRKPKH